jgi:hypothetical protein
MMVFLWVLASCRLVGRRFGDTVCFSETLASTDESTRRQNPEEHHHHLHRHENLKSHPIIFIRHLIYSCHFGGKLKASLVMFPLVRFRTRRGSYDKRCNALYIVTAFHQVHDL